VLDGPDAAAAQAAWTNLRDCADLEAGTERDDEATDDGGEADG
jgi:hypothetical protein